LDYTEEGKEFGSSETDTQFLDSVLGGKHDATICDIGFGRGGTLVYLAGLGYSNLYGIDLIESNRQELLRRLALISPVVASCCGRFFVSDFMTFTPPVDLPKFDLISCFNVLEHIHPDEALDALHKIYTMLKPGGSVALIVPNRLYGPSDVSGYFLPTGTSARGFHLKEYLICEIVELYKQAGFDPDSIMAPLVNPKVFKELRLSFMRFGTKPRRAWLNGKLLAEKWLLVAPKQLTKWITKGLRFACTTARRPEAS
jgi:SAM-dependent methyltransferase